MHENLYHDSPLTIRSDLDHAHQRALKRISEPGSWWTGSERVAIAQATRDSETCEACQKRMASLSASGDHGVHQSSPPLTSATVDLVHRVARDASRLSRASVETARDDGISVGHYVELVAVVANIVAIDRFCRALGLIERKLPEPVMGEPDRYVPESATSTLAWVPTIDPNHARGCEKDIYANQSGAHIHRALTLVPKEKHGFFDLDDVMYLPDKALRDFTREYRDIDHAQIELLAARVSALNRCEY